MVDNQHQRIAGYRDLSEAEIAVMNEIKAQEAQFAELWRQVIDLDGVDKQWAAVARTHVEEGCSALVRSVARPVSPFDSRA
jgi:hypothetical protein